jgi:hypothetical protein
MTMVRANLGRIGIAGEKKRRGQTKSEREKRKVRAHGLGVTTYGPLPSGSISFSSEFVRKSAYPQWLQGFQDAGADSRLVTENCCFLIEVFGFFDG